MGKGSIMIKLAKKGNKKIISISRKDWEYIGKTAGWADVGKGLWNATKEVGRALPQSPNDDVFSLQTNLDRKNNQNNPNQQSSDPSKSSSTTPSGRSVYDTIPAVGDPVICTRTDGSTAEGVVESEDATAGTFDVKLDGLLGTIEKFEKKKVKLNK
jgi:hypothetical protein